VPSCSRITRQPERATSPPSKLDTFSTTFLLSPPQPPPVSQHPPYSTSAASVSVSLQQPQHPAHPPLLSNASTTERRISAARNSTHTLARWHTSCVVACSKSTTSEGSSPMVAMACGGTWSKVGVLQQQQRRRRRRRRWRRSDYGCYAMQGQLRSVLGRVGPAANTGARGEGWG
jgi:hypothetical protein